MKICDKMTIRLEKFKKRMEPAKQMYTREISDFASNYDTLGEMTTSEYPDIDCQEYIFEFENVNGASDEELDQILLEIHGHMVEFSKVHGIEEFSQWVRICL